MVSTQYKADMQRTNISDATVTVYPISSLSLFPQENQGRFCINSSTFEPAVNMIQTGSYSKLCSSTKGYSYINHTNTDNSLFTNTVSTLYKSDPTGNTGIQGNVGLTGSQDVQGVQGVQGDSGQTGQTGKTESGVDIASLVLSSTSVLASMIAGLGITFLQSQIAAILVSTGGIEVVDAGQTAQLNILSSDTSSSMTSLGIMKFPDFTENQTVISDSVLNV